MDDGGAGKTEVRERGVQGINDCDFGKGDGIRFMIAK